MKNWGATSVGSSAAFTLTEMLVAMGASVVVLGGLMLSSLAMQKSLSASEKYAVAYSDQRRLTDFIGRDLRRAIAIEATDAAGVRSVLAAGTISITGQTTLILRLPGYYRSDVRNTTDFDQPLDVVGTDERLDYGTDQNLAPAVEVIFRKVYLGSERSICYVREEAGVGDVIVRKADDLFIEVTVLDDGQTAALKTWFHAQYSRAAPLVTTYDQLLLRNPPLVVQP